MKSQLPLPKTTEELEAEVKGLEARLSRHKDGMDALDTFHDIVSCYIDGRCVDDSCRRTCDVCGLHMTDSQERIAKLIKGLNSWPTQIP